MAVLNEYFSTVTDPADVFLMPAVPASKSKADN
jgi:hypothetical protein